MGVNPGVLNLYVVWATRGLLQPGSDVLELGAQELFCAADPEALNRFLVRFGAEAYCPGQAQRMANQGMAGDLMQRAGFRYSSIDYKPYPYSIKLDLNRQSLPPGHRSRYHLVTNIGTSEHILNQWNVFKTMHDATTVGGLMFRSVPFAGDFEHGLFNYNPKFWWALVEANGYDTPYPMQAWTAPGVAEEAPASFRAAMEFPAGLPKANTTWVNVLLRKATDRPFAGLIDPAFK